MWLDYKYKDKNAMYIKNVLELVGSPAVCARAAQVSNPPLRVVRSCGISFQEGFVMDIDSTKLTVFFEAPFWIGVFERIERRKLSVCKVVFGAEPKDYEVLEYLLKNYSRLRFSPSVETVVKKESVNPKRLQRQIRKETAATGIGTKSQQALQMQREENKLVRKALSRKQREAEKQRQFELKQQKRKEKHRGR